MTDPVPEVVAQLAQSVTGTDVAGIYGDPARAGAPVPVQTGEQIASDLQAKGAAPAAADPAELMKQIAALQQQYDAAQKAAEPAAPSQSELHVVASGAGAGVVRAFELAEQRISALEKNLLHRD